MSLSLYFLRHGETSYSQNGTFCGDLDPELTANGLQMAQEFAAAYRSFKWAGIYASPMKRTQATARPLCEALNIKPQLRDGLKEIRYGQWEGLTADIVKQQQPDIYLRWLTEPAWNAPPGGETAMDIANRAMKVIVEITDVYPDGNILIVSHKATIRVMLCSLLGIDLGRYRDRLNILTGAISIIKLGKYGPMLEQLGDRSYMSETLRADTGT